MKFKEIMDKILSKREDLSEDKILALIEEIKKDFQGLLSNDGAALLVAQDLDVDLEQNESFGELQISDLISGLNDVTITGRVVNVWPLKEFEKADGSPGKLVKFIIADKTDKMICLLWDSKAEEILKEEDLQGKILKILHGYTKEGISGKVELHLGYKGDIIISPKVPEENFPKLEEPSNEELY